MVFVDRLGSEGLKLFRDQSDHTYILPNGEFAHSYYVEHPLWYQLALTSLAAFVNAFFVAGMTEEFCKYLCFWMVEHPDLEIQNKVMLPSSSSRGAHRGETKATMTESTETTGLLSRDQNNTPSSSSLLSDHEQQPIFAPTAPLASIGEAITVAMITVALGFACAENLLYVFIYTPPGLSAEISTLYVRCLFPIHPMAAALQSIGVCRRDLEKDPSVGVGRIIFPAWLLHGCFDFSLMAYTAMKKIIDRHNLETSYRTITATNPPGIIGEGETADADQGLPFLMYVMAIPFIGMMYFLKESFYQRERLEQMDKENRIAA